MRPLPTITRVLALASASAVLLLAATSAADSGAAAPPAPCPSATAHPWCNRALSPDARALLFQRAMTQDEEISLVGGNGNGASPHTGATFAVPRLGLRAIYFSDGPVGPRQGAATALPIPMAAAATWSPSLAYAHGQVAGEEAKDKGNDFIFGPTVNIMRTPQGGRSYEAYGEDTFLVARTTMNWVRGAQAAGVIATTKHFVANNQEGLDGVPPLTALSGGRMFVSANVAERTLREVYFPQFEAAVKQANTGAVMCSYNRVNDTYACENPHTLQQVLERQWGFKGIVLADYGASKDTAADMNNGLDFVPDEGQVDQSYQPQLIQLALALGTVRRAALDAHVRRILRTLFAYGVFDRPGYRNDDGQIPVARDQGVAERVEERAITLLKNNGILPLRAGIHRIAVIGPYANKFVTGGGSGGVTPRRIVTTLQGIAARAGRNITVSYADGSDPAAAAALARAADVAIVVVGDVETEGQDKSCIDLNCDDDFLDSNAVLLTGSSSTCLQQTCPLNGSDEDGLIKTVAAAQPKTVVVLQTGAPVLTPWRGRVPAILEAWYPGQEGGTAIARVLFGDIDPGGRLPVTFPADAGQLPTAASPQQYPGVGEQESYSEGLLVGYKWYDAHSFTPAFPFGAGLSYTTFRYGALRIKLAPGPNQVATASLTVANTGRRSGIAVPELYVSKPATGSLPQPPRQLVGYDSVAVPAGRTMRITFPLNARAFASWTDSGWALPAGCYRLLAGSSSRVLPATVTLSRGASCPGAAAELPAAGDFALPVPPPARAVLVKQPSRRPRRRHRAHAADSPQFAPVDRPGPRLSVAPGAVARATKCSTVTSIDHPPRAPILLVPGTGASSDDNYSWNYERAFDAQHIPWCAVTFPADGNNDIQVNGEYLVAAIRTLYGHAGRRIDIIGHSQGGMVPRWALRFWPDTRPMLDDVVGFAGTNHGTILASASCPRGCIPAGAQQASDSRFIRALNSGQETFAGISYTEVYSHFDEEVEPNQDSHGTSSLHGGGGAITNVAVQDVCPLDVVEHLGLGTYDPVAYALAMDAVEHAGPADPSRIPPSVCFEGVQPGVNPLTFPTDAAVAAYDVETSSGDAVTREPSLDCYVFAAGCAAAAPTAPVPGPARAPGGCVASSALTFTLHAPRGTRTVAVTVRLDGHVIARHRGHALRTLRLRRLPLNGTHTLRITTRSSDGSRRSTVRRYRGCRT